MTALISVALLAATMIGVVERPTMAAAADPPDLQLLKEPLEATVAGTRRTTVGWRISFACASVESPCENTAVTDTLPPGLQLKSVTTAGGLVKGATISGNSVTWALETPGTPGVLDAGSAGVVTIQAQAGCDATKDQTFSNTATMTATNAVSEFVSDPSAITVTAAATCAAPPPPPPSKSSPSRVTTGGRLPFFLTLPYAPSAYDLIDPVVPGLAFEKVSIGAPAVVTVSCDGGTTYVAVTFSAAGPFGACVKNGKAWNATHIKFSVPAQTDPRWGEEQTSVAATINMRVPATAAVGTSYTNTTGTTAGGPVTSPLTATGTVVPPGPMPALSKSRYVTPGEGDPYGMADDTHPVVDGDLVYRMAFGNTGNFGTANGPLIDPTITDLLDPNVDFIDGESWWRIPTIGDENMLVGAGCRTPTFEKILNWNGTGRTMLRWKFVDCTFPGGVDPDPIIYLDLDVRMRPGLSSGTAIANRADILGNNGSPQPALCDAGTFTDAQDLDGDGDVSESLCSENGGDNWIIPKLATIDATKWVNGAADPRGQYIRFPAVGQTATAADGFATYQIYLDMRGNVTADRIELVDVMPYLGDSPVLNPKARRKSDWSMVLAGPVIISTIDRAAADATKPVKDQPLALWQPLTAGATIKYSTSNNPCRLTADVFGKIHVDGMSKPTGCMANPWDITDPAGARSFAIDLDSNVDPYLPATKHGDLLRITVTAKDIVDPVTAAELNGVAWNSFAYTVKDTEGYEFLSTEPIKVGVTMTASPPTVASLGDVVWWDEDHDGVQDPEEEGINGVTVHLYDTAGNLLQSTITGFDPADAIRAGYYKFYGLDPDATYTVKIERPQDTAPGGPLAGYVLTGTDVPADDALDNDAALIDGVPTIAAAPTGPANTHTPTYDFGFYKAPVYSLGNRVWFDENNSGALDNGETGAGGVVVNLLDSTGSPVLDGGGTAITTTTDGAGYYRFDNLRGGDYIVEIAASNFGTSRALQGRLPSTGALQEADPDADVDSNDNGLDALINGAIRSAAVTLGPVFATEPAAEADLAGNGQGNADKRANMTVDFGVFTPRYAIGNIAWFDADKDGIQDAGEPPVTGVVANLYRDDGTFVESRTTGADGQYYFDNQLGGTYYIEFVAPTGHLLTSNTGADPLLNSNADPVTGRTPVFTLDQSLPLVSGPAGDPSLVATRIDRTIDVGFIHTYTLGNLVWDDFNDNGIADDGEAPIPGVLVELYTDTDGDGTPDTASPIQTATTGTDGKYLFVNLTAGKYLVRIPVAQPAMAGLRTSGTPNATADDNIDNDNNGVPVVSAGVVSGWLSGTVALGPVGSEPTTETGGLEPGSPDEDISTSDDDQGNWTVDFGFHRKLRIGNQVWLDGTPGSAGYDNGKFDAATESGIQGVSVELWSDNGDSIFDPTTDTQVATTVTDGEGNYWFENVEPGGKYFAAVKAVSVAPLVRSSTGQSAPGATQAVDAGDNDDDGAPLAGYLSVSTLITAPALGAAPTGETDVTPAENAETEADIATHPYPDGNSDLLVDFGFIGVPQYRLGNLVWIDADKNGIADPTEAGLAGVRVELFRAGGGFIGFQTTDAAGHYVFDALPAGPYEVRIPQAQAALNGYFTSPVDETTADLDGDGNDNGRLTNGYFTSGLVTLGEDHNGDGSAFNDEPIDETLRRGDATDDDTGTSLIPDNRGNLSVDFAFYQPRFSLGNQVWFDLDDSGTINGAEGPVPDGVIVNLLDGNGDPVLDANGAPITTTTTGGLYLFSGLLTGTYRVEIDATNLAAGGLLDGYRSSTATAGEDAVDGDDNGSLHSSGGLRSAAFTLAEGTEPTAETPDNDPTTPDGNENLTVDFGIVPTFSLGNEIWLDFNDDGIRDAVEITVPDGTVVNLLDANGNAVLDAAGQPRTTTTVNGLYLFDGLLAGGYIVEIPASQFAIGAALEGTRSSTPTSVDDSIAADGTDHGAASNHGIRTGVIDLSRAAEALGEAPDNDAVTPDGNENLTWDIGLVPLFSLGNEVWYDADDDGIKASDEDYVADGVIVNLYDPADLTTPIRSTQILNGLYRFTGLFAGTYVVELAPENFAPGGLIGAARSSTPTADPDQSPTDQDDNGSDTTNAAAARVIRSSVTLTWLAEPTAENPDNESTIPDRNSNLTVDFGVVRLVAVGDYVWYDANNNGIQDPTELPVPNVGVALLMEDPANRDTFIPALDSLGAPVTATTTDAAGYYVFDNLLPGRYEIQFDVATLPTGYTVAKRDRGSDIHVDSNPDSTGLTPPFLLSPLGTLVNPAMVGNNDPMVLAGAINPTIDMGIYRPVSVGDLVWYDANRDGIYDPATESGLADVTVTLLMEDPTNPGTFIAATDDERRPIAPRLTGADGRYAFTHLIENTYRVEFTLPNGYRWTRTDQGLDDTLDSDATFTTTADATATSADRFVSALTPVADSDPAGLVMTDPSFDAGVWVPLAIGDRVWFDLDRNGTQDAGEASVVGAGVILLQETSPGVFTPAVDADGVAVPTDQVTDANGLYLFDNLLPGVYQVTFTHHQPGYRWTTVDSGSDAADSDAIFVAPADPSASTGRIDLQIGAIAVRPVVPADVATYGSMIATYLDPTNDAGIWIPLAVGDYVWFDLNHNGVQDVGEKPVGGVGVSLLVDDPANPGTLIPAIDADGNPVATTTTDTVTGRYLFDNLLPGTYRIQFDLATLPTGYVPSKQTQGADTTIDSNADQAGLTPPFTLAPAGGNMVPNNDPTINAAMIDPTIDLGIFTSVTLGDLVWYDADRNGVFDPATEHGITAVQVELLMEDPATPGTYIAAIDADGAPVAASFTDVDGRYSFTNLVSGKFKVVFSLPSGFEWTPAGQGADATLDSNAGYTTTTDATATSGVITVFADAAVGDSDANGLHLTDPSVDAGVWLPFAIGDQVWFDLDHNGAQDPTETPVAGATAHLVMAVADGSFIAATDADGNPVADATTDANGYYLFDYLLPGVYKVEFTHARSGYEWTSANTAGDALDSDAVYATATDPMAATGPITLSYGAVSVRGTTPADDTTYGTAVRASYVDPTNDAGIWVPLGVGNYVWFDANHNGLQDDGELPVGNVGVALWMDDGTGVFVPARDADGNAVATTTTDALTGMYSFDNLVPGTYQVRFDLATLPAGYVPTTPSAGADAGLDSNPDLTGLSGQFTLSATGANMVANADGTLHASLIDPTIDMGIWQPLAIGDVVWNDIDHDGVQDQGEAPVPGVKVELLTATGMPATDGNGNLVPPATTDAAGHYVFDSLFAGDYQIRFTLPAGFIVTTRGAGADPLVDSNTAPTGLTPVFTLSNDSPEVRPTTAGDGVTVAHLIDPSIDAGIWQPLAIGDFVWYDLNHNGLQDAGEQPVAGVTVTLLSADGSAAFDADGLPVTPTTTDANGHYVFDNLVAGDYRVRFSTLPSGYLLTTSATGTDRLVDSNPAGDGLTAVFTLQAESAVVRPVAVGDGVTVATLIDPSIDAGIWIPLAIGDVVWFDTNHNGVQDQGERPVPGVRVELLNADGSAAIGGDGQPVPAATTDANGRYVFDNLPAGDYQIRFSGLPVGYEFTTPTALSATTGSDSTPARTGLTATFTLSPGAFDVRAVTAADGTTLAVLINPTIDAGIWQPLAIGDIVFLDTTENGRQDPGEKPVPGIKVELLNADGSPALDADGRPVAAVTTDSNGHYLFDNLLPGDYQVQFSNIPQGYTFTEPSTAGSSSSDDSNPSTTGRTPVFHLDGAAADVRPGTGTDGTSHMVNPTIDAGLIAPGPGVLPGTGTNAIDIVRLAMIVGALGAALLIASRRRRRVAGAAR